MKYSKFLSDVTNRRLDDEDLIITCDGSYSYASWLGDDYCDDVFDCAEFGWDDGDCEP